MQDSGQTVRRLVRGRRAEAAGRAAEAVAAAALEREGWAVLARRSWKTLPETDKARWEEVARTPSSHLARFRD